MDDGQGCRIEGFIETFRVPGNFHIGQHAFTDIVMHLQQKGYTCLALSFYWKNGLAKCQIGLAKGKQQHDKRHAEKDRDWQREKQRIFRNN